MQQIIAANEGILRILRKPRTAKHGYRMIKYCLALKVDDGVLLHNTLTKELLLLTEQEYADRLESDHLRKHWFVIPSELNEKELLTLIHMIRSGMDSKKGITGYTILTTTDCNARCYYCYELGRKRTNMDRETAAKTAEYISQNCCGNKVNITWFGGEPLYNMDAIDTICTGLTANGVCFESMVISNGYLFGEKAVEKAVRDWNVKRVQVSLDGTEEVYNRAKAFIYKEGSAYQIVLRNIKRLLQAGIRVQIRLNVDLKNVASMMELADELASYFSGETLLTIYTHLIFDDKHPSTARYSSEELTQLHNALWELNEKIEALGFASSKRTAIQTQLKMHCCMADNDHAAVITPTGHIGVCEHHSDDEFIGHLDSDSKDASVIARWKERRHEIPECDDCFYYPDCMKLELCPTKDACYEQARDYRKKIAEHIMLQEYLRWRGGNNS